MPCRLGRESPTVFTSLQTLQNNPCVRACVRACEDNIMYSNPENMRARARNIYVNISRAWFKIKLGDLVKEVKCVLISTRIHRRSHHREVVWVKLSVCRIGNLPSVVMEIPTRTRRPIRLSTAGSKIVR